MCGRTRERGRASVREVLVKADALTARIAALVVNEELGIPPPGRGRKLGWRVNRRLARLVGFDLMDWICVRCGGRSGDERGRPGMRQLRAMLSYRGSGPVLVADPDLFLQITKFNFIDTRLQLAVLDENLWKKIFLNPVQNAPKSHWSLAKKIKFLSVTDALLQ